MATRACPVVSAFRLGTPPLLVALAILTAVALGCGGGGGGGGSPTGPGPGATFTSAGNAGANSLALAAGAGGASSFSLELRASQVSDLYGVALDLSYPSSLLRMTGNVTEGDFLSAGGTRTTLTAVEQPAGNIIIGLTRLGDVRGAGGSGLLLRIEFSIVGAGNGEFRIQGNAGVDSDGRPINSLSWVAGSIRTVL